MTTEKITCNFIGDFKIGDNLVSNGTALCRLRATNENGIFNKLIVVQVGSMLEAALDQIVYRAQNFTAEGVPNIPEEDLQEIRSKQYDSFNRLIQAATKYNFLDGVSADVYAEIDRLRELRNRIHIQFDDKPAALGRADHQAFNDATVNWALTLCISVLKHLAQKYPRPAALGAYAHDLEIPKP
jgi:hypothetical protein